jgi:hypothetical protein
MMTNTNKGASEMTRTDMKNAIVAAATKRLTSPEKIIERAGLNIMQLGPLALDLFDELRKEGRLQEVTRTNSFNKSYWLYCV